MDDAWLHVTQWLNTDDVIALASTCRHMNILLVSILHKRILLCRIDLSHRNVTIILKLASSWQLWHDVIKHYTTTINNRSITEDMRLWNSQTCTKVTISKPGHKEKTLYTGIQTCSVSRHYLYDNPVTQQIVSGNLMVTTMTGNLRISLTISENTGSLYDPLRKKLQPTDYGPQIWDDPAFYYEPLHIWWIKNGFRYCDPRLADRLVILSMMEHAAPVKSGVKSGAQNLRLKRQQLEERFKDTLVFSAVKCLYPQSQCIEDVPLYHFIHNYVKILK